jgi:phage tail-like protein
MSTNGAPPAPVGPPAPAVPLNRPPEAPGTASARAYLRGGLPGLYRDGRFGMRFVTALEQVLDPIVAMLDSLHAHLDPDLAPEGFLDVIGAWLGLIIGEEAEVGSQRAMVRSAMELTRRRGTAAGLQLLLDLRFPSLRLDVDDGGYCRAATGAAEAAAAAESTAPARAGRFTITSRGRLSDEERASIQRLVDFERPVHVAYELVEPEPDPVTSLRPQEAPR